MLLRTPKKTVSFLCFRQLTNTPDLESKFVVDIRENNAISPEIMLKSGNREMFNILDSQVTTRHSDEEIQSKSSRHTSSQLSHSAGSRRSTVSSGKHSGNRSSAASSKQSLLSTSQGDGADNSVTDTQAHSKAESDGIDLIPTPRSLIPSDSNSHMSSGSGDNSVEQITPGMISVDVTRNTDASKDFSQLPKIVQPVLPKSLSSEGKTTPELIKSASDPSPVGGERSYTYLHTTQ